MIEGLLRYLMSFIGLSEYIKSQLGRVETQVTEDTYCLIAWDRFDKLIGKICVTTEDTYLKNKLAFFIDLIVQEIKSREREKNK